MASLRTYFLCLFVVLGYGGALRVSHNTSADGHAAQQDTAKCLNSEIRQDWLREGIELVRPKSSGRAYVACIGSDVDSQYKVSCNTEECDGDKWCFVKNHCGGFFNPCRKIEPVQCWQQTDVRCRCSDCDESRMAACAKFHSRGECPESCTWQGPSSDWPLDSCAKPLKPSATSEDECVSPGCEWAGGTEVIWNDQLVTIGQECRPRNHRVTNVTVWTGRYVNAIQFHYDDLTTLTFGSIAGGIPSATWNVPPGEYIMEVLQNRCMGTCTNPLGREFLGVGFKTSLGSSSPWYGAPASPSQQWNDNYFAIGNHVVGFATDSRDVCGDYTCIPGMVITAPLPFYGKE